MSKKHYQAIAIILGKELRRLGEKQDSAGCAAIRSIEGGLISLFQRDNPNFSRDRFREAVLSV